MITLLAQAVDAAPADTFSTGTMVALVGGVVTAAVTAVLAHFRGKAQGAREAVDIKPQPLKVKEEKEPTWAEVAGIERRVSCLEEHFERMREEQTAMERRITESAEKRTTRLLASQADSSGKIHRRIDDILAAVSRLEGKLER
jgi:hypothetical protein